MAIIIHPCRRCPASEGCPDRATLRERASKTGAASITFRCQRLAAEIRPGRRIVVSVPHAVICDRDGDTRIDHLAARATITHTAPSYQFSCVVDPGDAPQDEDGGVARDGRLIRFRKRRKHSTIVGLLDEPDATLCRNSRVQRDGVCDNPDGCYRKQEAETADEFSEFANA